MPKLTTNTLRSIIHICMDEQDVVCTARLNGSDLPVEVSARHSLHVIEVPKFINGLVEIDLFKFGHKTTTITKWTSEIGRYQQWVPKLEKMQGRKVRISVTNTLSHKELIMATGISVGLMNMKDPEGKPIAIKHTDNKGEVSFIIDPEIRGVIMRARKDGILPIIMNADIEHETEVLEMSFVAVPDAQA